MAKGGVRHVVVYIFLRQANGEAIAAHRDVRVGFEKVLEAYAHITMSSYGLSIGLTQKDVDNNVAHSTFSHVTGLNVVDYFFDDSDPNPVNVVSLAAQLPNILDCLPAVNLQ